jgi:hypothetical protein
LKINNSIQSSRYLGAMDKGVIILDVSDKNNISFVSQFVPDVNYPVANPNPDLYNARGMVVKNSIVYLCYDAGGLRIINCTNKNNPVETGRYSNPVLHNPFNLPRAYNNLVLDDTLLYVAVDYCGVEVLNISDTSNITLDGWWNPYNCPNNNWFSSPSHANEIRLDKNCNRLFVSTGKSDLMVLDISNPTMPDSCDNYGGIGNNIGTWGVNIHNGNLYLSYICALVPFFSNWTGVKVLTYDTCPATSVSEIIDNNLKLFPNPTYNEITIESPIALENTTITIFNAIGQVVKQVNHLNGASINIDVADLNTGIYYLSLQSKYGMSNLSFVKE